MSTAIQGQALSIFVLSLQSYPWGWRLMRIEHFFLPFFRPLSPTNCIRLAKNGLAENSGIQLGYQRFLILISQLLIEAPYSGTVDMKYYFSHRKPSFSLDTSDWHFLLFNLSYAHNIYCCESLTVVGVVRNSMGLQLSKLVTFIMDESE